MDKNVLTDEAIFLVLKSVDPETARLPAGFRLFARAIERAVLAASEQDRRDAAIGRYVLQHAVMVDQSVEGLTRLMLADDCTNGALSDTIIAAIAAAGNHKVEGE